MKYLLAAALALSITACATFQNNLASEKLITQYAVMKVIEADKAHMPERAQKIYDIAQGGKSFFDSGTATLEMLDAEIHRRLVPLNMSPADALLADALVQTVVGELNARVGNVVNGGLPGVVPRDTVYQVSTVLGWVADATAFYK